MTLNQAINQAKEVTITFHPSGASTSQIKISKVQAYKIVKENRFDLMNPEGDEEECIDEILWYGNFQGEIIASYNKKYKELNLGA